MVGLFKEQIKGSVFRRWAMVLFLNKKKKKKEGQIKEGKRKLKDLASLQL